MLLTDGVDQGSRLSKDKAIYGIYYFDPSAYGGFFMHPSDADLRRIAEDTGGRVFKVDRKTTLDNVFQQLQDEMRSQYAIGYTALNEKHDGTFRRVEVHVRDKNLKVQARKGYYAAEN